MLEQQDSRRPVRGTEEGERREERSPERETEATWESVAVRGESSEDGKAPIIYEDDTAQYIPVNPQWEVVYYNWTSYNGAYEMSIEIPVNTEMYSHFASLDRMRKLEDYRDYATDLDNRELIRSIVDTIADISEDLDYDDTAMAKEFVSFVQESISYEFDSVSKGLEEYPRYPVETLYEGIGDCEDTSILLAAMLREWGFETGFLYVPGHLAVVIRTSDNYEKGPYYEHDGHRYLYIETTGENWHIGEIPEEVMTEKAEVYLLP